MKPSSQSSIRKKSQCVKTRQNRKDVLKKSPKIHRIRVANYAAPRFRFSKGVRSIVWRIFEERTGNSLPHPWQTITHPWAWPSIKGRLLSGGSVLNTRIFSQSGQLTHSTMEIVRVCWIGMHNSCNRG